MLNEFRTTKLIWDTANDAITQSIESSSGDSKGRKLQVQIMNKGEIADLTGCLLSLAWNSQEGYQGLDSFTPVDEAAGIFEIYYTKEMLLSIRNVSSSLVLVSPHSRIESKPFSIKIYPSMVKDEDIEKDNSYTVLAESLKKVSEYYSEIKDVKQDLVEKNDNLISEHDLKLDTLHSEKNESLTNLEEVFENKASVLEETYTPRLIKAENTIQENHDQVTKKLGSIDYELEVNKQKIDAVDRGYGETFDTLEKLNAAYQDGNQYRHVVAEDGNWYYWKDTAWVVGGKFQEQGISDGSVDPRKTSFFIQNEKNLIHPMDFTQGYVDHTGEIVSTGQSRVSQTLIDLNPNSIYRLQSRIDMENTTIYLSMYNKEGLFTRRFLVSKISDTEFATFRTGSNDQKYRLSCIAGDEFNLFLHEGEEYLPFEEPLIMDNSYIDFPEEKEKIEQPNFVELLQKHNQINKPLKAKVTGDRVFWVYQPIANGKYIGHSFEKDAHDDFVVYASAVVGIFNEETFVPEQYLMAGSNKEFAIRLRPQGSTDPVKWFPEHENTGTAFSINQSILFDGVEKVGELRPGTLQDVYSVTLSQEINLIYPGSVDPIGKLSIVTSVTSEGVTYKGHIEWLKNLEIERGYVAMLPTVVPPVDTLRTSVGNDYVATLSSGSTDLIEGDEATSYAFLNKNGESPNTSYVLAQTILNPEKTFRKGEEGRKHPLFIWLEHRSKAVQKLYPQVYLNHSVVAGETLEFGSTIYVGILPMADKLLF